LKLGLVVCGKGKFVAAIGRVSRKEEIMELGVYGILY
jgi:hypothetical protein